MKKINEIFYSLQGEGYFTGTPSVFIRFSGCNLKCPFCDTQHEQGDWMTEQEIIDIISAYPASHLVLTGGEPSLFIDKNFINTLHKKGYYIQIETNGTHSLPDNIDWVTCSPKENSILKLSESDELKIVYTGQDLSLYTTFKTKYKFLQPCSGKNTDDVINYVLQNPDWRLSLQIHKLIGIE